VKKSLVAIVSCLAVLLAVPALAQDAPKGVSVFHAGSLTKAMGDMAGAYTGETGVPVKLTHSGSGSLRQRIEKGERPDVFASADMNNPAKLAAEGLADKPVPFARNQLCVLARKSLGVTQENLVQKLMDPSIKVGTSTPVLDPGGDYAWTLFDKIGGQKKGAAEALKAKAIKLVGDPALPMPPKSYPKNQISWHFEEGRADVFLLYVTTARLTVEELPDLMIVELPDSLAVGALYGVSVVKDAGPQGEKFRQFVLDPKGQAILAKYGFKKP